MKPNWKLPDYAKQLFKAVRYKILWGGRGSSKSWTFAAVSLIKGMESCLTILCAREFQNSIDGSVHSLLATLIKDNKLSDFYTVTNTSITGKNGTVFSFVGLRRNIFSLKSFEGVDICWIEEAQTVSRQSWDILIPTIRKTGSEIWIGFNPDLETDETYQRFVLNPPKDALVIKVNHSDNPFFPSVLRDEMEDLKARDYDAYLNVWEGHCKHAVDGAVYMAELRDALSAGQITKVPYEPTIPVHTFWDLGYADYTAIWFAQYVGLEIHVIDYYQQHLQSLEHYVKELDTKKYRYGTCFLPHDAKHKTIAAKGLSIETQLSKAGYDVKVQPAERKTVQIQAVRRVFPKCYFDEIRCTDGLNALRRYKYKVDPQTGRYSRDPDHDEYSHGADAFAQLAISMKPTKKKNINLIDNYADFSL